MQTLHPASLNEVSGGAGSVRGSLGKLVTEILHADASGRYADELGNVVMAMRRKLRGKLVAADYEKTWKTSGARRKGFEGIGLDDMLAKAKSLTRKYP